MSERTWAVFFVTAAVVMGISFATFGVLSILGETFPWPPVILGIAVISVASGAVLDFLAWRFLAKPTENLARGMRQVANGNFDTTLDTKSTSIVQGIEEDFNKMTESLLAVEALRESFVSNVAHEFKTPLAYIQGYATLLQDNDLSTSQKKDYIGHINNATRRLSTMIGNLLEISNLNRPNSTMETEEFSLDEQLRHVLAIFIPQIDRKSLSYEVDLDWVDVEGNESLLEDAWTNLISNAIKYTPSGGTITITLKQQKEHVSVVVADTGCGMTKAQVEHAFDRFYQAEDSHGGEGNGLGLAIVRAVIKKHGGSILVKSAVGKGTTFTINLPIRQNMR